MSRGSRTERLTFTIPPELVEELDELAVEWKVSRAQVIKYLLMQGLTVDMIHKLGGKLVVVPPNDEPYLLPSGDTYKLSLLDRVHLLKKKLTA